jgi:serine/threonine-protein kinase
MTSPTEPAIGVVPGDVLAGKYRVERVLGVGGMGVVVAAHHVQLDERVALKFLLPEMLAKLDLVARFLREARAAVKIKNEHVARVIDVGELDNGSPYIVMEYLEGQDLAGRLSEHGPLAVEQAVDFVLQACEALADAHALGIVHRDLKPANLFCIQRSDGQLALKVLDFGISKMTTPGTLGHDMTKSTALLGSPFYMSPEQMEFSKGVDSRTDIWSLGVVLFELLTGRRPFQATAVTELAIKVRNEPAPLLRAFRFDAPTGLEEIVARCLEKDRSRRYANVGELAVTLGPFGPKHAQLSVERVKGTLERAGVAGPRAVPELRGADATASDAEGLAPQTAASWAHTSTRTQNRGRRIAALGALAGLAVVGVAMVPVLANRTPPAPSAASAAPPPPLPETVPASASAVPATSASPASSDVPPLLPPTSSAKHGAPPPGHGVQTPPKNCSPPYVVDSDGVRHHKPECY